MSLNGCTHQTYTFNPSVTPEGSSWKARWEHPWSPGFSAQLQLLARFHIWEWLDICKCWVGVLIPKGRNQCSEQTFSSEDPSTCSIRLNYQMLQTCYGCPPDSWQNNSDASEKYFGQTCFPPKPTKTQVYQQQYSSDMDTQVAKILIQNANFRICCRNFHLAEDQGTSRCSSITAFYSVFHSFLPPNSTAHNGTGSLNEVTSLNSLTHRSRLRRRCKKTSKKTFWLIKIQF